MKFDIVRAWEDEAYRQGLSEEQLSMLPTHPAGELELTDADLETIFGAADGGSDSKGDQKGGKTEVTQFKNQSIGILNCVAISLQISIPVVNVLGPTTQLCQQTY